MTDDFTHLVDTCDIMVDVTIRLGRTRQTVAQLSALQTDDVITLDQAITDGVEICIGDRVIARGELTGDGSPDDRLCVRIIGPGESA